MQVQSVTSYSKNSQSFGQIVPKWRAFEQIEKAIFDAYVSNDEVIIKNTEKTLKEIKNLGGDLAIDLHAHRKRMPNTFQFSLSIPHTKEFEPITYDKTNPVVFLKTLSEQIKNSTIAKGVDKELEKLRLRECAKKASETMAKIFRNS